MNGLVAKRAEIAGRLEANEAEHRRLANELRTLNATIRIFEPDLDLSAVLPKPVATREAAYRGEVTRIVFDTLRAATSPMTSHEVTHVVLAERGLLTPDADLFALMRKRVGAFLLAKRTRASSARSTLADPFSPGS